MLPGHMLRSKDAKEDIFQKKGLKNLKEQSGENASRKKKMIIIIYNTINTNSNKRWLIIYKNN